MKCSPAVGAATEPVLWQNRLIMCSVFFRFDEDAIYGEMGVAPVELMK